MTAKRTALLPYLALVVGIVCLGFSAIFVRAANAPGVVSSFYRMGIAAVVFALPFARGRLGKSPLPKRGVFLALLGGLFFGLDMTFWSEGIMISGVTNPTLMANTAPAWVGIGALVFFRERLNGRFMLGLGLAILGAAIILGMDSVKEFSLGVGTAFGLVAGMFYGGFFLIAQRGRVHMDVISFFWFSVVGSTAVLLLIGLVRGVSFTDYPVQSYYYFLAAGLISQVVGWFAITYAQGFLPATIVSPTLLGQPVMTAVLAVVLLGEVLTSWQVLGGAAIIAGIYVVHRSRLGGRLSEPGS